MTAANGGRADNVAGDRDERFDRAPDANGERPGKDSTTARNTPAPGAASAESDAPLVDRPVDVHDPDTWKQVTVVVRELRYGECMKVTTVSRPLFDSLAAAMEDAADRPFDGDNEFRSGENIERVLCSHVDIWRSVVARATLPVGAGADEIEARAAWFERMTLRDGAEISSAVWTANKEYIDLRVRGALARAGALKQAAGSVDPDKEPPEGLLCRIWWLMKIVAKVVGK